MAKEIKQWITVNHIHIPIFEGETVKDAVNRMKKGARKGKDTRPISKESYEKKAKAADKAYKSLGEHSERLLKANKKIKEGDNSPEAKKEFMNAERTLKEAGQRFQKRSAEHQEAVKHPKYTSIKVKKGEKKELQKNIDHVQSKSSHTLANDLKSKGFELDSADRHTIENSNRNDYKVTLFDKNKNEYEGTFNRYNDGGTEIVNITKKSTPSKKEDFVVDYKIPDKIPTEKKPSASAQRKAVIKKNLQSQGIPDNTPNTQAEAKQMYSEMKNSNDFDNKVRQHLEKYPALKRSIENSSDESLRRDLASYTHLSEMDSDEKYKLKKRALEMEVEKRRTKYNGTTISSGTHSYKEIEDAMNNAESFSVTYPSGETTTFSKRHERYTEHFDKTEGGGTKTIEEDRWYGPKYSLPSNHVASEIQNNIKDKTWESVHIKPKGTEEFNKVFSPKETWRDKDAEIKAKQIANAEAQKAERNSVRHYGPEIEDEQFRKDALAEMRRYKSNWDFYSAKERQNISPNGIKELDARIKEIEDYEKNLKKRK